MCWHRVQNAGTGICFMVYYDKVLPVPLCQLLYVIEEYWFVKGYHLFKHNKNLSVGNVNWNAILCIRYRILIIGVIKTVVESQSISVKGSSRNCYGRGWGCGNYFFIREWDLFEANILPVTFLEVCDLFRLYWLTLVINWSLWYVHRRCNKI